MIKYVAISKGQKEGDSLIYEHQLDDSCFASAFSDVKEHDYLWCESLKKRFEPKNYPDFIYRENLKTGEKEYVRNYFYGLSIPVAETKRYEAHFNRKDLGMPLNCGVVPDSLGIVDFYSGGKYVTELMPGNYSGGKDFKGRNLLNILSFSDKELEETHDYIQVLFPLFEPSPFNLDGPVLNNIVVALFKSSEHLRKNQLQAFNRMVRFYGLEDFDYDPDLEKDYQWLTQNNHNFLRLTRIMKSMSLLGNKEAASRLHSCLIEFKGCDRTKQIIGEKTFEFWNEAVK